MITISYRSKQRLRRGLRALLLALVILAAALILTVVFMGRYVVYTQEGAHLDFGRSTYGDRELPPETSPPVTGLPKITIDYADPNGMAAETELVSGYYIDLEMLQDASAVLDAVRALDTPCTVMIDLKGGNGNYYYSCGIDGTPRADVDVATVDTVISYLKNHGFTMVARVRTLQDSAFALDHYNSSLRIPEGALWVRDGFYWLDPSSDTVVAYLKQIARDLAGKGFKEIVFDDFRFPDAAQIVYTSDKGRAELMEDLAEELLQFFASSSITISFGNPAPDFPLNLPSRVYVSDVTGSGVKGTITGFTNLEDVNKQVIFLTGSKDNRFEGFQLLRPLLTKYIQ